MDTRGVVLEFALAVGGVVDGVLVVVEDGPAVGARGSARSAHVERGDAHRLPCELVVVLGADAQRPGVDAADDGAAGVVDAEDLLGVPPGLAHRRVLGVDVDHVDDRVEAPVAVVALVADPGILPLVAGRDDTGLDDLPQTAGVGDPRIPHRGQGVTSVSAFSVRT